MKLFFKKISKVFISRLAYLITLILLPRRANTEFNKKTLLIIKLDSIGDYVLFRNFLEIIKKSDKYRDYKITYCGNNKVKNIAEELDRDYVDEFIWVDRNKLFYNPFYCYRIISCIVGKFSEVIHPTFSRELIIDIIVKFSGASKKIGFQGETNSRINGYTELINIGPEINFEFYKNISFFSQLLKEELNIKKPSINPQVLCKIDLPKLPSSFVLLFPGAQQNFRKWPALNFKQVADYIISKYNINIVICGSKEDAMIASIINSDNSKKILDLTGKTNLAQSISLISQAKLVISNDTSGAHIGAALDVQTIVLSQFNNYSRFIPYPPEISNKIHCVFPTSFKSCTQDELISKFKNGSTVDISLISTDDVKIMIDKIL